MFKQGKNNTVLLELIMVILFFAISTAVTLRMFAKAHLFSVEGEQNGYAALLAQEWAEQLRYCEDPAALLTAAGFALGADQSYELRLNEKREPMSQEEGVYRLAIVLGTEDRPQGKLMAANLTVFCSTPEGEREVLRIPVARYRAGEVRP